MVGIAMVAGEGLVYDWYTGPFAAWLGLGCATGFRLSDEDMERLSSIGIPIDAIAGAEVGRRWCGNVFGANVDIGIVLAIMEAESGYGANMGSKDWLEGIRSNRLTNHAQEEADARWLLEHWEKHNLRSRSPAAARQIYSDYTGYYGHGSGEIGDGFLPSTAKWVCEQALMKSGDADMQSCNFFSRKVNGHAIPWVIYRSGYSSGQSFSDKVDSLWGWNHSQTVRISLVTRAEILNLAVGVVNVITDISSIILEPGKTLIGDLKLFLIMVLDSLGLLPDRIGWLEMPLREEDLNRDHWSDGISQDYMETTYDSRGHPGIDFVCKAAGVDVIAVANGVIVEPNPSTLMGVYSVTQKDKYYGNNVWIDHGGLYALYAHLNSVDVKVGDTVTQGEVIGKCGSTGNSTGPHVHFQVLDNHPDEMVTYRQEEPGNINPHTVLGTCLVLDGIFGIGLYGMFRKRRGEMTHDQINQKLLSHPPPVFSCCVSYLAN
jgi:murein DD-endopeptidase MepM/ murein hydrolase activator NlpD